MVRPRENALCLPSAAKPIASCFWSDRFRFFWKKIADGRIARSETLRDLRDGDALAAIYTAGERVCVAALAEQRYSPLLNAVSGG